MLTKHKRKNGKVKVTFNMPTIAGCQQLCLCGDFNEWNATATPMTPQADGSWSATLELEPDREYQYQ